MSSKIKILFRNQNFLKNSLIKSTLRVYIYKRLLLVYLENITGNFLRELRISIRKKNTSQKSQFSHKDLSAAFLSAKKVRDYRTSYNNYSFLCAILR